MPVLPRAEETPAASKKEPLAGNRPGNLDASSVFPAKAGTTNYTEKLLMANAARYREVMMFLNEERVGWADVYVGVPAQGLMGILKFLLLHVAPRLKLI